MTAINHPSSVAIRKPRSQATQPLHAADNADALLKLKTLQALAGLGKTSIYQRINAGELTVVRIGKRCTRVTGGEAKRFLQALGKGVAA